MLPPRLPGVWYASHRETAFFLIPDGADRRVVFATLFTGVSPRRATEGEVVENACFLTTPDGDVFQAITWQSKRLGAWRRDFVDSTRTLGIVTAQFYGRRLITSDGRRYWFRDLVVVRDDPGLDLDQT